jgi:hypothetical protein
MKITKRQLKRIIKEEKTKILRESPMLGRPGKTQQTYFPSTDATMELENEFSQVAIEEMEDAIAMFAEDGYPEDARDLEAILDRALEDMEAGGEPSESLETMYMNLDTIVREAIPHAMYAWMTGNHY